MTERDVNERRNWKAQTFPYDYYLPDDSNECTYCLTDRQAELLRGLVEPLGWTTRWWRSGAGSIDLDVIEAYRADLVRRLMMGCCGDEIPVRYRYTVDGVLQRSDDGGETWTDAPEYDPRNYSPTFPPVAGADGDDKKCVAATGMTAILKAQVGDQLTDDMSYYTLSELITDWVGTMIESSNPFQALITIAANQIFALVIALLRPALTTEVYDTLLCIFYCNMGDDASFTDAQITEVRSDIGDEIGGIATLFFQQLVFLLGSVGMTNLARAGGASEGDCTDCDCPGACGLNWIVYPVPEQPDRYGTIIDVGDNYITVQSGPLYAGKYWVIVQSPGGMSDCCTIDVKQYLPGGAPAGANGLLCGENYPVHGVVEGQEVWLLQFEGFGGGFTVQLFFS